MCSCGVEASEESESRSRHSAMAYSESKGASGGVEGNVDGGQVQSSRSLDRICCFAVRTASSFALDVMGRFVARGCRSEAWLEREGDSWLPLDVFSVASVVGHVEEREGRLSAEELRIVGDSSGESPQCMWTFTIYSLTIVSGTCMGARRCGLFCTSTSEDE